MNKFGKEERNKLHCEEQTVQTSKIPHSAQTHPFPQVVDAMSSWYDPPTVSLLTQQHQFHQ